MVGTSYITSTAHVLEALRRQDGTIGERITLVGLLWPAMPPRVRGLLVGHPQSAAVGPDGALQLPDSWATVWEQDTRELETERRERAQAKALELAEMDGWQWTFARAAAMRVPFPHGADIAERIEAHARRCYPGREVTVEVTTDQIDVLVDGRRAATYMP